MLWDEISRALRFWAGSPLERNFSRGCPPLDHRPCLPQGKCRVSLGTGRCG
jgi:hypothetical protein